MLMACCCIAMIVAWGQMSHCRQRKAVILSAERSEESKDHYGSQQSVRQRHSDPVTVGVFRLALLAQDDTFRTLYNGLVGDAYILGIESSCDETAAAVVRSGEELISNVVYSQFVTHRPYGGVVPELASREHLRAIVPVVRQALEDAGLTWIGLDAVAATSGPGLAGSLLVGLTYAKAIAFAAGLPLIAVNHIEGHIHAVILEASQQGMPVELPALALIVSGGHTHLFEAREEGGYRLLGRTRDDA